MSVAGATRGRALIVLGFAGDGVLGVEEGLDLDVALKGAVQVEVTDGGVRRLRALGSKKAPCVVAPSLGAA